MKIAYAQAIFRDIGQRYVSNSFFQQPIPGSGCQFISGMHLNFNEEYVK